MTVKTKSAKNVTGFLCRSSNGRYFFRVYDKDGEFVDYDISHTDLEVTISSDCDATFYENEKGETYLDHSPETLGLKTNG